jgi:5-formyltetrahydrofolate cyclo-ligase
VKSKNLWRKWIKEQLKSLSASKKTELEKKLCSQIESYMMNQDGLWSCYLPLPDEADILSVLLKCSHISWCLPRVENEPGPLTFWKVEPQHLHRMIMNNSSYKDLEDPLFKSMFHQVSIKDLNGFIVPGLAFDKTGTRLGRGKGYFDRTLVQSTGVSLGVGFAFQLIKEVLPADPWDQKMNVVITDCEIHDCKLHN